MTTKKSVVLVHKNPMPSLKETVSSTGAGTWTIDHNYNAAKPEKNVISTSVFYESCMYHTVIFNIYLLYFPPPLQKENSF